MQGPTDHLYTKSSFSGIQILEQAKSRNEGTEPQTECLLPVDSQCSHAWQIHCGSKDIRLLEFIWVFPMGLGMVWGIGVCSSTLLFQAGASEHSHLFGSCHTQICPTMNSQQKNPALLPPGPEHQAFYSICSLTFPPWVIQKMKMRKEDSQTSVVLMD